MFEKEIESLIRKGRIKIIKLASKRKEIKENQLLLLKDDWINVKLLLVENRNRGAYIHAFDALERIIDIILIENGYQSKDRYARKLLIAKILGKEFLEEYEELFEKRKNGMYDVYGIISKEDVEKIMEKIIPKLLEKANVKIE